MVRPKVRRLRVKRHGRVYNKVNTLPPTKPIPVAPAPPAVDPSQQLTMELIKMVADKPQEKENAFTLIKFVITAVDPTSIFGKFFYTGLLILIGLWLLNYTGLI